MKKILIYIASIFVAAFAISCTSECYVSKESKLGISFIDSLTYKAKNITKLTVIGLGSDSVLYNNATLSAIYLPLHSDNTSTSFKFILPTKEEGKETPDTILLHINHTPKPQLISEECGCSMFHTLNDAQLINNTYNFKFDIVNSNITNIYNDKETQIKILH